MCQLIFTIGIVLIVTYHGALNYYIQSNLLSVKVFAYLITTSTYCPLICSESIRRNSPANIIFFLIFTFGISLLLAIIALPSYPEHTFYALSLTVLICITLTIFAFQTKIELTTMVSFLVVAIIVLICVIIIYIIFPGYIIRLILSTALVILFSFCLVFDTKLMINGEHEYSITPDDYIMGALSIYVDIVFIFLFILGFAGASTTE